MKGASCVLISLLVSNLCCLVMTGAYAQAPATPSTVTSDEMVVYAAVLHSLEKLGESSHFLIAESTSTFACNESTCNGFAMGGCNGLRTANETPSARLTIVKRDLQELQGDTAASFEERNRVCASIRGAIPTEADYRYLSDPGIPPEWKDKYLVYFSRVGFNPDQTQALVDISLVSWTDGTKSGGMYIVLNKVGGKWVPAGSSAVWRLMQ